MKRPLSLPRPVAKSLAKLGADIRTARKKRGFTVAMLAERVGISRETYANIERGRPSVALGAYAAIFFALGFGTPFGELIDPRKDDVGLLLDEERMPQRVRPRKEPQPL